MQDRRRFRHNSASSGPDRLLNYFLRRCVDSLDRTILDLFNLSLNQGSFPKYWKTSYIQPFFKKGNKHDVTNYRPISQIGSVAKIFDSIVASKLSEFLLSHIIQEQHGFVKDRSTIANLLLYSDYISRALEQSH